MDVSKTNLKSKREWQGIRENIKQDNYFSLHKFMIWSSFSEFQKILLNLKYHLILDLVDMFSAL